VSEDDPDVPFPFTCADVAAAIEALTAVHRA